MASELDEDEALRSTALRNASAILAARERADEDLVHAKEELEIRTRELSYSLSLMQATFEATADGILVTDTDGRVLTLNQKFLTIWGLEREAVEGTRHIDLVQMVAHQFSDAAALARRLEVLYSTPGEALDTLALADGRVFERYSRPQHVDGEVVGRVWSYRDVSARLQAEDAARDEALVLDLLNRTGAAIASTLDLAQLLQIVTDAATRLSGAEIGALVFDEADAAGEAVVRYTVLDETGDRLEKLRQVTLAAPRSASLGGPLRVADLGGAGADGAAQPRGEGQGAPAIRSYMAVPVTSRDGARIGQLVFGHSKPGSFSERTERLVVGIAAQASTAIDNARLYEESKRVGQERERLVEVERAARAEIMRTSRLKDEFLATLSHELRTPLTAVLGWAKVLLLKKGDPETLARGLETIHRNALAQARLIDDLLDMHRTISGKVRLDVQPTDVGNVIEAAVEAVRPAAEAKEIRLRKVIDPDAGLVSGDPNRLQQVLWNLLTNAVKFTPRGGSVDVVLQRVASHLEIGVSDSGVGIAADFLPSLFDRFRQADSSPTRSRGGLGLGLSIVKQLVELHGGSVRARSDGVGQGATFVVQLPLTALRRDSEREHHPDASMQVAGIEGVDLAGLRVLVVDDEADTRELIRDVLGECLAEVHLAASAGEALAVLQRVRPDVLLSDVGMPDRDGYQLIRDVRRLAPEQGGRTPAIAFTAFARSEDRTRAMLAGYQVHMSKPIEPRELLATVASLVGRMRTD